MVIHISSLIGGPKLSTMVRVLTHFCPYLATQYASHVPRPSRVFIGCSPSIFSIQSSSTPIVFFQSCFIVEGNIESTHPLRGNHHLSKPLGVSCLRTSLLSILLDSRSTHTGLLRLNHRVFTRMWRYDLVTTR